MFLDFLFDDDSDKLLLFLLEMAEDGDDLIRLENRFFI